MQKKILLLAMLIAPALACAAGARPPFRTGDTSLKAEAPLPVGVAIGYRPMMYNATYRNIVISQFDNVTFEYALKNGAVVRPDGSFNYAQADTLAKICTEAGLHIYGHTLCWYQNNSPYLSTLKGDSTAIEQFLKKYIFTTISRYRNVIHAWDVVNEAIDSAGRLRVGGTKRNDYFYWGKYLKQGYIARAFRYAHEADKNALLFYNDYDLETDTAKLNAVVAMVSRLKREGVPISGIGTQMHIDINTPDKGIDHAFRRLAATGLLVRISELDIKANPSNDPSFVFTRKLQEKQAEKCRYVMQSFFKNVSPKQRYGITFWNVGDKDSWIVLSEKRKDDPALFDSNYRPKPAYYAVWSVFRKIKDHQGK